MDQRNGWYLNDTIPFMQQLLALRAGYDHEIVETTRGTVNNPFEKYLEMVRQSSDSGLLEQIRAVLKRRCQLSVEFSHR